jgi:hypothetical protein
MPSFILPAIQSAAASWTTGSPRFSNSLMIVDFPTDEPPVSTYMAAAIKMGQYINHSKIIFS